MDFFDCNVILGKVHKPTPGGILDAATLLREMDRYGIAESLVYDVFARRSAPVRGNRLTSEAAAISPRLHPCWVMMPPSTNELPSLDDLAKQMMQANVKAVRLFPDANGQMFSLTPDRLRRVVSLA